MSVKFNEAEFQRIFLSVEGPVGVQIAAAALRVQSRAKQNASGRPGPMVQTGRLRSSIAFAMGTDAKGVYADIGTNVPYGRYLETGMLANGAKYPFLVPALSAAQAP